MSTYKDCSTDFCEPNQTIVEQYARTDKNSKRLAADLKIVFSKSAEVIAQLKSVTARVREVATGGGGEEVETFTHCGSV